MTAETKILTDERIFALAAETDIASIDPKVDVLMFSRDEMLQAGRAIEQAVLQSPEIQALRKAQGWQPIETAPKDGRQILLTNGESVAQGWWEHEEPYIRERRDIGGHYIGQDESDGFDGWLDCDGGMQPDPTHWMPLPAPPQQ